MTLGPDETGEFCSDGSQSLRSGVLNPGLTIDKTVPSFRHAKPAEEFRSGVGLGI